MAVGIAVVGGWTWASLALLMLALWLNNRAVGRSTAVPA